MRTSLFLVFLVSACAVDGSPIQGGEDAASDRDSGVDEGAAGMGGIVGLFQDARPPKDAATEPDGGAAGEPADSAVTHLKDASKPSTDTGAPPEDAATDAGVDADADQSDAADGAPADAAPDASLDAALDAESPPDDEGTCDLCGSDADCPSTHRCASDGATSGLRVCMPHSSYCAGGAAPPFIGGAYLTHQAPTWNACWPEQADALIGCAAWRQLVGIPE